MSGSSLIIQFHGWRGFGVVGGPFGREVRLGFVSVCYVPLLLTDWLRERIDALKKVTGESRGFVEMASYGEDSPQRPRQRVLHKESSRVRTGIHS